MIRTRVRWAWWCLFACNVFWSFCFYMYCSRQSLRRRQQRTEISTLSSRIASLETSIRAMDVRISSLSNQPFVSGPIQDASNISDETEPDFQPRFIARGRSRSKSSIWLWEDWETEPGVTQRRFILRIPFNSEKTLNSDSHK